MDYFYYSWVDGTSDVEVAMRKVLIASLVALLLLILFYFACYRLPIPNEFIEHKSMSDPTLKELKIERYDEDLDTIWYSHVTTEDGDKVRHMYGVELSAKWVFPFQNYYDKEYIAR